jgi:hypothetical protein
MCFHFFSSHFQLQLYFKGNKMNYDLGVAPSSGAATLRCAETRMIIPLHHRDSSQPRDVSIQSLCSETIANALLDMVQTSSHSCACIAEKVAAAVHIKHSAALKLKKNESGVFQGATHRNTDGMLRGFLDLTKKLKTFMSSLIEISLHANFNFPTLFFTERS